VPEIAWFGGRAPSTLGRANGTTQRIVTRCLADADLVVGFVAVGLVAEDAARAGEIHMIAADPEHQRAGVGSALMRQALAVAEAHGVQLAVIATGGDPGHAPARALYERFGFRPLPGVRYYRTL